MENTPDRFITKQTKILHNKQQNKRKITKLQKKKKSKMGRMPGRSVGLRLLTDLQKTAKDD